MLPIPTHFPTAVVPKLNLRGKVGQTSSLQMKLIIDEPERATRLQEALTGLSFLKRSGFLVF